METLPEDAEALTVLAAAIPDHHEVAGPSHRHRGVALLVRRVAVDLKLAPQRAARRAVALPEHAGVGAILDIALPDHDEIARVGRRHRGTPLHVRRVAVDQELRSRELGRRRQPEAEEEQRGGEAERAPLAWWDGRRADGPAAVSRCPSSSRGRARR